MLIQNVKHPDGIRPAIAEGWFYVPYEAFETPQKMNAEKRRLSFRSPYMAKSEPPIRMFKDLPRERYLGVPRAYGLERYNWISYIDRMVDGAPMMDAASYRMPDPHHPAVKEPLKQIKFMQDLDHAFINDPNFTAEATTGSGKTVCGTRSAIIRGRRTAILVPLERLMDMWHDTLTGMFGVPAHRIGVVQSDRCEFEDRDFVLCMMKSLGNRRYHPDFYSSIGTTLIDEVHVIGSVETAALPAQFPARVRCGLSATLTRTDGMDRVLFWHIGPIKVKSEAEAVDCHVYVKDYDDGGRMASIPPLIQKKGAPPVNNHGFRVKKLGEDPERNRILAGIIIRLWKSGRKVLAIGDHVTHVQRVMEICYQMGLPREVVGQCTGTRHERVNGRKVERKVTSAEFKHAKENALVVFATYGSFKMGVDEPRLDALVTLSPQSKDKQVRGRVRRPYAGKEFAIYVCLRDVGDWMSERYMTARQREWSADRTVKVIYGKI